MTLQMTVRNGRRIIWVALIVCAWTSGAYAQSAWANADLPCFTEQNALAYGLWARGLAPAYFVMPEPPAPDPEASRDPIALFAGEQTHIIAQAIDRKAAQHTVSENAQGMTKQDVDAGDSAGLKTSSMPSAVSVAHVPAEATNASMPTPAPTELSAHETNDVMTSANDDATTNTLSTSELDVPALPEPDPAAVAAAQAAAEATAARYADPLTAPLTQDVAPPNAFLARAACLRGVTLHESLATRNIRMLMRHGLSVTQANLPFTASRSKTPGEGAIGFQVLNETPYQFNLGMNNAGMTTTGKMQGTANLLLNNPLGMNDKLSTSLAADFQNARHDSTDRGLTANYTLPIDTDWSVGVLGKTKASTDQMASSTRVTQALQWRIHRAFDMTHNGNTGVELRYNRERYENAPAQYAYETYAEVGLSHRHYFGTSQLDVSVMQRLGAPWMASAGGPPGWSYRFHSIDAKWSIPF